MTSQVASLDNSKISLDVSQVQEEERCTKPIETYKAGSNLKLRKSAVAFVQSEEIELEWKTIRTRQRYSIKSDNIV